MTGHCRNMPRIEIIWFGFTVTVIVTLTPSSFNSSFLLFLIFFYKFIYVVSLFLFENEIEIVSLLFKIGESCEEKENNFRR